MGEEWRDIAGYEDYYQVSSFGRVKSVERYIQQRDGRRAPYRIPEKILKPKMSPNGYLFVNLSVQGRAKPCRIHRLVAETFIPNPQGLPTVNHKDENKDNNRVDNLEWCTQAYNNEYGTRRQRSQESQPHRRAVRMLSMDGMLLRTFPTMKDAARYIVSEIGEGAPSVKIANNNIRMVCRNYSHRHKAYGYGWEYDE